MTAQQDSGGLKATRRTLVKGAAWSVPVVAMASPAMALACSPASCPPPPIVNWQGGCGSTGNRNGCTGSQFALQVPVTMTNTTGEDLLFVVEGAWSANGNNNPTPPLAIPAPGGPGSGNGFYGIIAGTTASCTPLTPPTACGSITPIASSTSKVLVPAGQTLTLWYAFNSTGSNASSFVGKIWYTWYDPETCAEVGDGGTSQTIGAIEPNNC